MALKVDIKKKFNTFDLEINFTFDKGILGVLGASGCGKSMTLKCIAGIVTPDEGQIILDDKVLFDSKAKINLSPQQRNVGYLFQNYALFPHMTVSENIAVGIKKAHKQEIIAKYLKLFYLEDLCKAYPRNLSGGQQQRVALARIFASEPDILMLDEPFSALDDYLKWQLELEMAKILKLYDKNILFVSHNRDEIYRFCNQIAVLAKGKLEVLTDKKSLFEMPQTLAASKLSGCKNHSRIEIIDTHHLKALDWNLCLYLEDTIAPNAAYVGIRAHEILLIEDEIKPCKQNTFEFVIEQIIENIFSIILMVRAQNASNMLRVEIDKANWQGNKHVGDTLKLVLPAKNLFPLTK